MQTFIANGRVAAIADDALGRTNKRRDFLT